MKRGDAHRQSKRDSHRHRPLISRDLPAGTLRSLRKDLKKQSRRYRKRLKRCQKKFSEKAVHALRVQSRRLLSTIELLEHFLPTNHLDCIRHALKCNLDIFDDLRDNQVQILAIAKMRRNFPAARSFYALLQRQEKKSIRQAHRDVQKATGRRLKKLIATGRKDVKRRGKDCSAARASRFLLAAVDRAFAKALHLRKQIDPQKPETIHCTRVAFKRFRYMFEALSCHAPQLQKEVLPEIKHYQTMMGDIQDSVLLLAVLDKFIRKNEFHSEAATRLRDELLRRRQWLIRNYVARADQLKEFWK